MTDASFADYEVGDRVWCLAWVGQPFEVVGKDEDHEVIALEIPEGWGVSGQIDIYPETMFMLSKEHWDQIWYWPDRSGQRYDEVFGRFLARHTVGQVVPGYVAGEGLAGHVAPGGYEPKAAMMFRITSINTDIGQVLVEPVAAVGPANELIHAPSSGVPAQDWRTCGPVVPIRIEMKLYRWVLTFGAFALNWYDLPDPGGGDSRGTVSNPT